jgi:hypothetical protein
MRNFGRLMLAGAGALTVLVGSSVAAASPQPAGKQHLTGYVHKETNVTVLPDSQRAVTSTCPSGDDVVGGGGFQGGEDLEEDLNSSAPNGDHGWTVTFNNQTNDGIVGVAVAICVGASRLKDYSVQTGSTVDVPANSEAQATVTCPGGTVDLGGGWVNQGPDVTESTPVSAPLGTNGWQAFPEAGSAASAGYAMTVCAKHPRKWAQVSSSPVVNPANFPTQLNVACPTGTKVLGGGAFASSANPLVTIGVTDFTSRSGGWSTIENNNTSSSESVVAWAVCAQA